MTSASHNNVEHIYDLIHWQNMKENLVTNPDKLHIKPARQQYFSNCCACGKTLSNVSTKIVSSLICPFCVFQTWRDTSVILHSNQGDTS